MASILSQSGQRSRAASSVEIAVTANEASAPGAREDVRARSPSMRSAGTATVTPGRARRAVWSRGASSPISCRPASSASCRSTQHIDETFSVRFAPRSAERWPKAGARWSSMPMRPTRPSFSTAPRIDVGALVEEYFVLAIDPYPRAPGAALPADLAETATPTDSPFAVLAGLLDPGAARAERACLHGQKAFVCRDEACSLAANSRPVGVDRFARAADFDRGSVGTGMAATVTASLDVMGGDKGAEVVLPGADIALVAPSRSQIPPLRRRGRRPAASRPAIRS